MRTLIITEKPSVARDFGSALGARPNRDGFLKAGDVTITWTVGHLLELFEPQDYDQKWRKWRFATLPIVPPTFRYKPIPSTAKQLKIVQSLLKDDGLQRVVIATDAGREGEVIARTVLISAGFASPDMTYRFWTSQALTPEVILDGLNHLRPAADFDRLWRAGQARQISDWLVGINGSRAATLRLGDLFSVGRVQTAVLALLVDRLRERERFQPEPYWLLRARFKNDEAQWWGTWFNKEGSRIPTEAAADQLAERVRGRPAVVATVKKQIQHQPPPPLYSLTDLQRGANQKYGFSAKHTLDVAQVLYDQKKCLSYPRTESRVLGSKNVELAAGIVGKLNTHYPSLFAGIEPALISAKNKRVFNDAKLTDHHALIPLGPLPAGSGLDQEKIYQMVLSRFAAAFHPDHVYEQTEVVTKVLKERFRARGKRVLNVGWQVVYQGENESEANADEKEMQSLPALEEGAAALTEECTTERKMTNPPPAYTDALLLKDMTNPARYVEEKTLKKVYRGDVGLGTQATRAHIIETLLQRKYARRAKKLLIATEKGCRLIDTLRQLPVARKLTSPEETARWERQLDEIARGEGKTDLFLDDIRAFVSKLTDELRSPSKASTSTGGFGQCPRCGGAIIEGNKGYGCSNWRKKDGECRFVVWKSYEGCRVTPAILRRLLKDGYAGPLSCSGRVDEPKLNGRLKLIADADGGHQVIFEKSPDDRA